MGARWASGIPPGSPRCYKMSRMVPVEGFGPHTQLSSSLQAGSGVGEVFPMASQTRRAAPRTAADFQKQLRALAQARGGVLLSRRYLGDTTKLRWRCARGHVFWQIPGGVKQGKWCRLCGWIQAGQTRRGRSEIRLRQIVRRRGGTILSKRYVDTGEPPTCRCAEGHEWTAVPASLFRGTWCKQCSGQARFAAARARAWQRYQRLARRQGGEVVKSLRVGSTAVFVLRCARGHERRQYRSALDKGYGHCVVCSREAVLERIDKHARAKGGALLSGEYVNEDSKLRFRCAQGHEFPQRAADSLRGRWCPRCDVVRRAEARKAPTRARFYGIVEAHGGTVRPPGYHNSQTRLWVRCAQGHDWRTAPAAILGGRWCPTCRRIEWQLHPEKRSGRGVIIQRRVRSRFEALVQRRGGEVLDPGYTGAQRPLPLRCERGHEWIARPASVRLGAWCPSCKGEDRLAEMRALAAKHGGECLSERCVSGREMLEWRCAVGHHFRKQGSVVRRGRWCTACRGLSRGELARMRQIAGERGGACLSTRYVDAQSPLRWRCAQGHEWSTDAGTIVQGRWCPTCRYRIRHSLARLRLEDMRLTAAERGGKCLSSSYHGSKVRLRWRCARGHTWMAHPNRVRQGSWCRKCSHSSRGTLDGMRALAHERGGRCLSRAWNDHSRPLHFECVKGHRFRERGNVVKTGVWCPQCAPRKLLGSGALA